MFIPNKHNRRQRYCSKSCRCYAYQLRSGRKRRVAFGMCKYERHERTPKNTRIMPNGTKRCRDCEREAQQRRRRKRSVPKERVRASKYYRENHERINQKRKLMRALGLWK